MHVKMPASAGSTITVTNSDGSVVSYQVSKDHQVSVKTQQEADTLLATVEGAALVKEEKT